MSKRDKYDMALSLHFYDKYGNIYWESFSLILGTCVNQNIIYPLSINIIDFTDSHSQTSKDLSVKLGNISLSCSQLPKPRPSGLWMLFYVNKRKSRGPNYV